MSQRSISFDDSSIGINEISLSGRAEVSPGKVGDGLFPPSRVCEEEEEGPNEPRHVDSEAGLSSEEENLIAQTTSEIRNILGNKARPAFISRFMLPESQNEDDADERSSSEECASEAAAAAG